MAGFVYSSASTGDFKELFACVSPQMAALDRFMRHQVDCFEPEIRGMAAYCLNGLTFLKRFACDSAGQYADMGCNFEVFTRHDMLEVESLGTLGRLAPGESAYHTEHWAVLEGSAPEGDDACADWLGALAQTLSQP